MKVGILLLSLSLLTACGTCRITGNDFGGCSKADLYRLILNKQSDSHSIRSAVDGGWETFNAGYQTWTPFVHKWEMILDRMVALESGATQTAVRELRIEVKNLLDDDVDLRKGAFRRISIGPPVGKLDALERQAGMGGK